MENSKRTLELDTKTVYTMLDTMWDIIMTSIELQKQMELAGKKIPKKLSKQTRKIMLAHADLQIANKRVETAELESIFSMDSFQK